MTAGEGFSSPPSDGREHGLCLITGASGFIGGHVAQRLVDAGYRVRGLVRPTSNTTRLARLGVELTQGDLTDPASLRHATQGCRYVVHSAALVSDWETVGEIRRRNVAGTRHLLDAASAARVERFVHVSTTDIYGYPGGRAVDETAPPGRFRNWYAQTKLEAEEEVHHAARAHGLEAVILRPATVYGPGSEDVVGEMADAIRAGHMIVVGGGRAIAGLTYVTNVADAAALALQHRAAPGQAFNITDGLPVTWRQFLDDLADGLGSRRVRWSLPLRVAEGLALALEQTYRMLRSMTRVSTPPLLSRQAVHVLGCDQDFSNAKARSLLGWEPRVGYRQGLEATLKWLLSTRST
jgi:nucleoside-diphosphate-sugar epimerase